MAVFAQHLTAEDILGGLALHQRKREALRAAGLVLVSVWKEMLSRPGRGRLYPRGIRFLTIAGRTFAIIDTEEGRRADHVASAPGDPPAVDTGGLRQSIDMDEEQDVVIVGSSSPVAAWLEFGVGTAQAVGGPHPGGIIIEPRPHARPALEQAKPLMTRAAQEALRGE